MVASLAVAAFVARRLLFGRSPVLGGEVFTLIVTAAGLVIGLCVARGTRRSRDGMDSSRDLSGIGCAKVALRP